MDRAKSMTAGDVKELLAKLGTKDVCVGLGILPSELMPHDISNFGTIRRGFLSQRVSLYLYNYTRVCST